MKRKIYVGMLLFSVSLLLTACTLNKKTGVGETGTGNNVQTENQDSDEVKGSLFDLVKLGKNVKCTFEYEDENGKSSGETYVSGKKARSDFVIDTTKGEKITSHTITDGEWMYTWSSASNQGMKTKIADIESSSGQEGSVENGENVDYSDYRNNFDYKCNSWIPVNSKFSPPEDITFVDLGDLLNQF